MYETYEAREGVEEYGKGGREEMPTRILDEDSIPSLRRPKRDSGWVFISRKADIGIVIVMILAVGLGIMWLVSRLPFFLEAASANYSWAMDMYATWGTPSMRWLFINVVVGVIVATSGLLSAFGGDGVKQEAEGGTGYGADRVYGSTVYRNEAPAYSPYLDGALHHGAWNFGGHERVLERDPTEEMAEVTASPDHHHARGDVSREMPMPREMPREGPLAEEIPREKSREVAMPTDIPVPVTESAEDEAPSDLAESREVPMPEPAEIEAAEEVPALEQISEPEFSAGSRGGSEVEIISKILDPITEQGERQVASEGSNSPPKPEVVPQSHTFTIGRVIRRDQLGEFLEPLARKLEGVTKKVRSFNAEPFASNEISAPPPPVEESDSLPAPQTLPLPLPGPGSHRRRNSKESLDDPEPVSHRQRHPAEPADEAESKSHRRRHSGESAQRSEPIPVGRRPSGESMHRQESSRRWQSGEVSSPPKIPSRKERFSTPPFTNPPSAEGKKAGSPPASPHLRQRSLVYPPALYSQASIPSNDASAPPSPPMEEAIPPPPPPHLKLPPGRQISNLSTERLASFKFNVPSPSSPAKTPAAFGSGKLPEHSSSTQSSESFKKPPSSRHSRTRSAQAVGGESPSSRAQFERSLTGRSHRSSPAREEEIQQVNEAPKEDDLHQQIEDFLAKFHDNWRLQRQESLARYRKRLVELDEGGP